MVHTPTHLAAHDDLGTPEDARSGRGGFNVDQVVEDYLAGHSVQTAQAYARDIAHLVRHLDARGIELATATRADLGRYVRTLEAARVPPSTIRRRLAAIAGFYSHLRGEGLVAGSPADGLRRPRGQSAPRIGPDAADLARLLSTARSDSPTAELLVDLLLVQGLRVSEAVSAADAHLVCHEGRRALVVRRKGGRLGRQVAWRWVRHLAEEAGITEGIYPHLLRHAYVSQALIAGLPLPVVAAGAGHRDIRTTLAYAQALATLGASAGEVVWQRVGGGS